MSTNQLLGNIVQQKMLLLLREKKQIRLNIDVMCDDCEQHVLKLAEGHGESHTTRFISDHNKVVVHDTEFETIELPSYFTKRRLHKKYFFNKGWVATCNSLGDRIIVLRDNTDEFPPESPRYSIMSWSSFRRL